MGVVANLKAKLVMETDEYLAAAKKVMGETSRLGEHFHKVMRGLGRGYAHAAFSPIKDLFSVDAVDEGLRSVANYIKAFDFSKVDHGADAFARMKDQVEGLVDKLPLLGGAYKIGESIAERMFGSSTDFENMPGAPRKVTGPSTEDIRKFTESARPSNDALRDLEYQKKLIDATTDDQRKLVEAEHEREQVMRKVEQMMDGKQKEIMRERIDSALKELELAKQKAAERQKELDAQKDSKDFMEKMEESLRSQTMSERERFEFELARHKLSDDQLSRAREIYNLTHQERAQVTGVQSAVGSIRMAGAVDYSQARMASSLEIIKRSSDETSKNTKYLCDTARAA